MFNSFAGAVHKSKAKAGKRMENNNNNNKKTSTPASNFDKYIAANEINNNCRNIISIVNNTYCTIQELSYNWDECNNSINTCFDIITK